MEAVKPPGEVSTWSDVVVHVSNTLGWAPSWDDPRPLWKIRGNEASKLKRVAERRRVTIEDAVAAVEHLRQRRRTVDSPVQVVFAADDLKKAASPPPEGAELDAQVQSILAEVRASDLPDGRKRLWERRAARASNNTLKQLFINDWEDRR